MIINAGSLDRRLTIYSKTSTTDEVGQRIDAWVMGATIYAQLLELRTQDAARAGQRNTYSIGRYLIRYRADLTTGHRLTIDGATYDILSIDQPDRRATMILTVEQSTLDPIGGQ